MGCVLNQSLAFSHMNKNTMTKVIERDVVLSFVFQTTLITLTYWDPSGSKWILLYPSRPFYNLSKAFQSLLDQNKPKNGWTDA